MKMLKHIIREEIEKNSGFCYISDKIRYELIKEFLEKIKENKDYNVKPPILKNLIDDWDGYDDQIYIHNDKINNKIIFYEGWVESCWLAAYQKSEYDNLTKSDIINKMVKERFTKITDKLSLTIENYEIIKHKGFMIMKITLV